MAKSKKSPNMPDNAEVPISSMIDVVFLLIIFFVVTAAVDKDVEDEKVILSQAPNGRPVTKKDPRSIIINVRQDGTLTMGMHQVSMRDITKILEATKSKYGSAASDIPIIIRGDYHVQHYYIRKVMDAVKKTGLYKVRFNGQMESN